MMNAKAQELGLDSTHFITPHGLDMPEHYTTAFELAKMADYALNIEKFANIVNTKSITISINDRSKTLTNTNELLGNLYGVNGVKTGFTNGANRCLVTCCKRGDMDIICVVLGADTKKYRTTDSIKLIEYSFSHFKYVNIQDIVAEYFKTWKEEFGQTFTITKGISNYLDITYENLPYFSIPVREDLVKKFQVYINYDPVLHAPVEKGTSIGTITLELDGNIVYSGNIFVNNKIEQKNILDYLTYFYKNFSEILNTILQS